MNEVIHKSKDGYVILRHAENNLDWVRNTKSEYWTGNGWKNWYVNAKRYWREEDATWELARIRILSKKNLW